MSGDNPYYIIITILSGLYFYNTKTIYITQVYLSFFFAIIIFFDYIIRIQNIQHINNNICTICYCK